MVDEERMEGAASIDEAAPAAGDAVGADYEVVHRRLQHQGSALQERLDALNAQRVDVFGSSALEVRGRARVRTEHACVPRDIVQVGGHLLFGYEVHFQLKSQVKVGHVLSLHRYADTDEGYDLGHVATDSPDAKILKDPRFVAEFEEVFRYYRDARLIQLRRTATRLLAVIQTGASVHDVKVLRWSIEPDGSVEYIDNRGDRDHVFPERFDFEWTRAGRETQVSGSHPHLNILDTLFVQATDGDLTIKVENNTRTGEGIYSEPVEDANQTLDDGEFHYARVGDLILLRVRPFREEHARYLVFDPRSQRVTRIDAIGQACRQLPEGHGIVFPGGYYLQTGEFKIYDKDPQGLELKTSMRAPNGEDVLYVFHERASGSYALLPYNLIRKEMQTPIQCHGYSVFENGDMIVFRAESSEPTRVHPMQVWQTPFCSPEFAAAAPQNDSVLARVGNAELVRGISDTYAIARLTASPEPRRHTFEDLIRNVDRALDAYFWLDHAEVALRASLVEIRTTAEAIVDEFDKVVALRERALEVVQQATAHQHELLDRSSHGSITEYMAALSAWRRQQGHVVSLRETRFVDLHVLDALRAQAASAFEQLSHECVRFLDGQGALAPIADELQTLEGAISAASTSSMMDPVDERLVQVSEGLQVISEVVAGLAVEDATVRTRILEAISEALGQQNRVRTIAASRRTALAKSEGQAEFAAQFQLLNQAVQSALAGATTPERADAEYARVMVQIEELEARFSELDDFVVQITDTREDVQAAFDGRKQSLLDERTRQTTNLVRASERILEGIGRRALKFDTAADLEAFYAADPMVHKLRDIGAKLRDLGAAAAAEEVESKAKVSRQDALRGLRDKTELFCGQDLIRFGQHAFNVNTWPLELSLVQRGEELVFHLSGTDYFAPANDPALHALREYWGQDVLSETPELYRAEYLAGSLLLSAESAEPGLSLEGLRDALANETLLDLVREHMRMRLDEGYERGVHDVDATSILAQLLSMRDSAGALRFGAGARAAAMMFWSGSAESAKQTLKGRAQSLGRIRERFADGAALHGFCGELGGEIRAELDALTPHINGTSAAHLATQAGHYLGETLANDGAFLVSSEATTLQTRFAQQLERDGTQRDLENELAALDPMERRSLMHAWLCAFASSETRREKARDAAHVGWSDECIREATALWLTGDSLEHQASSAEESSDVIGLLGRHPRVREGALELRIDRVLPQVEQHRDRVAPAFRELRQARHEAVESERRRLRLSELRPRVMSSFVRNRLIDEVYLPLLGDNLAKQIGAAGASKRTDLMGLLLLVSPPGYGKTTLMEYIASRMGLAFVKISGPSLGHQVVSLDPEQAPNATARQEVEKINFAFEMGNNVMLYLDDIQHTNPELLQKFISLCDGQRRIEGVYRGQARTYDLRGKRLCAVMAGNPYNESGERFQIPDMLANRADTYNLGDVLSGREDVFALSYIENTLTSNAVLAPLASRDLSDLHAMMRISRGEAVSLGELSYGYTPAETHEITAVLRHLSTAREVLLKVNAEYVASASQEDAYRTEPAFKLQGSYRNMNKIAEKVVASMNDEELQSVLDDHYRGEAQTLTSGAEHNLLKLAELRGRASEAQSARWAQIKAEFRRQKTLGGAEDDPITKLSLGVSHLGAELAAIRDALLAGSRD